MSNKIRNKKYYWVEQNGLLLREWNEKEYSSLSPTDKRKCIVNEGFCPKCKQHLYYELFSLLTVPPITCDNCKTMPVQYREVELELHCLEHYEYYNEECDLWIPKFKLVE